jgi:uncharacterized protein YciI
MRRRDLSIQLGLAALTAAVGPAFAAESALPTWFIFLESGRKAEVDKEALMAMKRGHIDNFKRLFKLGLLMAAGPMSDPTGFKRGIVTVRANTRDELQGYFEPDAYVKLGYMNVHAEPATPHRALNNEGIDDTRIEEVRIVQIMRGNEAADAATAQARQAFLRNLLDRGTVGAWYTLHTGPVAEVLFARTQDTPQLEAAFAGYPGLGNAGVSVAVWGQWLSPGVVR